MAADKDVTGFSEFLDVWLPTRIRESAEPIIAKAERTIDDVNASANIALRNAIVPFMVKQKSLEGKALNVLDDQIAKFEGKVDRHHIDTFDKISARLSPIESKSSLSGAVAGSCPPPPPPPNDPSRCWQPVYDPAIGPCPGYENVPCTPTGGGKIENIPIEQPVPPICPPTTECPPQIECPPPPPCPPCPPPLVPVVFQIWVRPCKIQGFNCVYITADETPPLDPNDMLVTSFEDTCPSLFALYMQLVEQCGIVPDCPIPKPCPKPPQPLPPQCCPPGKIENIINVPPGSLQNIPTPGGGGTIINIQPPVQTIIVQPTPVTTFPSPTTPLGGGQLQNIPQPGQQGQCFYEGDLAYITEECQTPNRIKELWKEIGVDLSKELNGKTVLEFAQKFIDDNKTTAKFGEISKPVGVK